ncbi:GntR family transcriptional regulator [Streptomyces sp. NBC_01433]|uniref:GntR family transcriptional regulator n=1 Tax=Streptomyces sp. NBC_01433 TaxID=2903864 RepID=UPI002259ACA8|nr:GntR family transcriptional regulator [Streptomyces sp. NBC_01433]MCX4682499.1 GntR family transcriptional regulator [Streptomyces sp. NBC_01433]MCX4682552.1 GntR family transcriptional regulator [Streptomyces sp. NBC_01433]
MPEIDRPIPPYMQVVNDLRARIVGGELAEGDTVPSERQIAEDWGISRATATKVLASLRSEGLVESLQGIGTVVRARASLHHSPADRLRTMTKTGRIYPPGQYAVIKSAGLAPAPAHVAEALGIAEGAQAIRRHRVTHNEDGPVSSSVSWFHAELADAVPSLLEAERIPGGTPGAIEQATGRSWIEGQDQIGAKNATAEEAEALGLAEGAALIVGRNTTRDAEGGVIEYGEYMSAGDRWSTYSYTRTQD